MNCVSVDVILRLAGGAAFSGGLAWAPEKSTSTPTLYG